VTTKTARTLENEEEKKIQEVKSVDNKTQTKLVRGKLKNAKQNM